MLEASACRLSVSLTSGSNGSLENSFTRLKSLSPINLVKVRLPDFLWDEFFIKMRVLFQNNTFEICNLSKIMNVCCKYIFFLNASDRKVYVWFCSHVYRLATVVLTRFSFSTLIYKFNSLPANIVNWLGKTILMPNYWPSRSGLRWMSIVRKLYKRKYFRFTDDVFLF